MLLPVMLGSVLLASSGIYAQDGAQPAVSEKLIAKVNAVVDADTARLTAIFKDLHQHPEIAFTETRTAGIVAKDLKSLGFTVTEGIGKTGVVGMLKNGPGPTVWSPTCRPPP